LRTDSVVLVDRGRVKGDKVVRVERVLRTPAENLHAALIQTDVHGTVHPLLGRIDECIERVEERFVHKPHVGEFGPLRIDDLLERKL